ncbi:hypothetical protein KXD40_003950 [Peronospora effusa]|nr:hypothetical protein KXD40_003950 [Peronospora effusa]
MPSTRLLVAIPFAVALVAIVQCFPTLRARQRFTNALLKDFVENTEASNFFWEHADLDWRD